MDFVHFVYTHTPLRVHYWFNTLEEMWDAVTVWWWKFKNGH